jgi:hypothetical protein
MKTKSLLIAAGSLLLLNSTAFAQSISAYKDTKNNVWITGLQASTTYEIKDVLTNGVPSTLHSLTNSCGQAEVRQAVGKYQSLTVEGVTFNISSLPSKVHQRCNPMHPNPNG